MKREEYVKSTSREDYVKRTSRVRLRRIDIVVQKWFCRNGIAESNAESAFAESRKTNQQERIRRKNAKKNDNDESSSIEKESSTKVGWKSEYSVSIEASKSPCSMFVLRPTITSQHHGKDLSLAGDIKIPSNLSTNHFPSSNTQHANFKCEICKTI